ncbi:MAG: hypothetical protein SFU25_00790 [Candidatus Caenarcaniphilales bacterium]|nr:hypothetical protein [Candidatus Caenarcaniphilales bacterium]
MSELGAHQCYGGIKRASDNAISILREIVDYLERHPDFLLPSNFSSAIFYYAQGTDLEREITNAILKASQPSTSFNPENGEVTQFAIKYLREKKIPFYTMPEEDKFVITQVLRLLLASRELQSIQKTTYTAFSKSLQGEDDLTQWTRDTEELIVQHAIKNLMGSRYSDSEIQRDFPAETALKNAGISVSFNTQTNTYDFTITKPESLTVKWLKSGGTDLELAKQIIQSEDRKIDPRIILEALKLLVRPDRIQVKSNISDGTMSSLTKEVLGLYSDPATYNDALLELFVQSRSPSEAISSSANEKLQRYGLRFIVEDNKITLQQNLLNRALGIFGI